MKGLRVASLAVPNWGFGRAQHIRRILRAGNLLVTSPGGYFPSNKEVGSEMARHRNREMYLSEVPFLVMNKVHRNLDVGGQWKKLGRSLKGLFAPKCFVFHCKT